MLNKLERRLREASLRIINRDQARSKLIMGKTTEIDYMYRITVREGRYLHLFKDRDGHVYTVFPSEIEKILKE